MFSEFDLADLIRDIVPSNGAPITNYAVMRKLSEKLKKSVSRDHYFSVRQRLIESGELIPVHGGYGGRVARARPIDLGPPSSGKLPDWNLERNLYQPFHRYLAFHWPRQSGLSVGERVLV